MQPACAAPSPQGDPIRPFLAVQAAPDCPTAARSVRCRPPRPVPASDLLPPGLQPQEYVDAYLGALGAEPGAPAIVRDVIGERLVVGQELFTDVKGNLKVTKRGREQYLPLLARALLEPDEIWARVEWMHSQARAVVRRRYVARFVVEGEQAPALAVFEHGADGWTGITTFQGATQTEEEWRVGVLLYKRLAE